MLNVSLYILGFAVGPLLWAPISEVWGRKVIVPRASGRAARYDFWELMGKATGAADYLELVKWYDAFVVTGVPAMTLAS